MGINWDYANEEAVDQTGVLTDHDKAIGEDPGWTRSVINKIIADQQNQSGASQQWGGSSWNRSDYSAEELAAWDWYQSEVTPKEKWDKIAANYRSSETSDDKVDKPEYDEDHQYINKPDSGFKPPTTSEYAGGNNASRDVVVSTEAINHLAGQIELVAGDGKGMLIDARNELAKFQMRPGGFARAELLRQKIEGANGTDEGLRGDTRALMLTVHGALFSVAQGLRKMAREYDTAEEFNNLTSEQLKDVMDGAWVKIGKIGGHGNSEGTTSGG